MACCIALTLLFSWGHGAWRVITRQGAGRSFAPPAQWPALASPTPEAPAPTTLRGRVGRVSVILGLAWFASGIVSMHVVHVLELSGQTDVAFHLSGLALAAAGIALLTTRHRPAQETLA